MVEFQINFASKVCIIGNAVSLQPGFFIYSTFILSRYLVCMKISKTRALWVTIFQQFYTDVNSCTMLLSRSGLQLECVQTESILVQMTAFVGQVRRLFHQIWKQEQKLLVATHHLAHNSLGKAVRRLHPMLINLQEHRKVFLEQFS